MLVLSPSARNRLATGRQTGTSDWKRSAVSVWHQACRLGHLPSAMIPFFLNTSESLLSKTFEYLLVVLVVVLVVVFVVVVPSSSVRVLSCLCSPLFPLFPLSPLSPLCPLFPLFPLFEHLLNPSSSSSSSSSSSIRHFLECYP